MDIKNKNDYSVYCDESRHSDPKRNPFLTIGGLWVPTAQKADFNKELRALLKFHDLGAEVKWSKTSEKKLEAYKALIDFFFAHNMNFRTIVVEQSKLKYDEFKEGDEELGFYTFYYEMLVKWLHLPTTYHLLLDFKKNKGADHHQVLAKCLRSKVQPGTTIKAVDVINSADSPLAQLADLLIGAVAASWCNQSPDTAKGKLASYIAAKANRSSLKVTNTGPEFSKFNLFRIDLK